MSRVYTLAEVNKHHTPEDCWIVIHDKVYDVTRFLNEHPGGEQVLIDQAGSYATEAFEDVGHSIDAQEMLTQFCIGEIHQSDAEKTAKFSASYSSASIWSSRWTGLLIPLGVGVLALIVAKLLFF